MAVESLKAVIKLWETEQITAEQCLGKILLLLNEHHERLSKVEGQHNQSSINQAKFSLGQVLATPGALEALNEAGDNPSQYLSRHVMGDWGDVPEEDAKENEFSVTHDLRILSAYNLSDGTRIWIITEADRSATTILLPFEY